MTLSPRQQIKTNILKVSRTAATGKITTTRRHQEKASMAVGTEVGQEVVIYNLNVCLDYLTKNLQQPFFSPEDVQGFVEGLAQRINKGVLKPGLGSAIRTWDITRFGYTPVGNLQEQINEFYHWFLNKLKTQDNEPKVTAALIEYRFNLRLHPLADGCSKTASMLSAFYLLRKGQALPYYPSRDIYMGHFQDTEDEWIDFYLSLFD